MIVWKRSLTSLACLGLLSACGGSSDDVAPDTVFSLSHMNKVEVGFQTFQQRDLAFDGLVTLADESRYVYKDRNLAEPDSTKPVVFTSENGNATQVEDLVVLGIYDLSTQYSALSIKNVTVKVDGRYHTGDYIFIQEKSSGTLYPAVVKGDPLLSSNINEEDIWYSLNRFYNIADQDRIYIDKRGKNELYIATLVNGQFDFTTIFDYQGRDFWINEEGDILSQSRSRGPLEWLSEGTTFPLTYNNDHPEHPGLTPYLYDGEFYALTGNATLDKSSFRIIKEGLLIKEIYSPWKADTQYYSSANAARINDYEMKANCDLFYFDEANDRITYKNNLGKNGKLAVAGQDSLFCVGAVSDSDNALPIITKLDTKTEQWKTVAATEGSLLDASQRFTVISDDEVMFSQAPVDNFNEYYINVEDSSEEVMSVTEASIVELQTLDR